MISDLKISLNGILYRKNDNVFGATNRAFRYGDSLFETIHANGTEIQYLSEHLSRLTKGMNTIGMQIPKEFNEQIKKSIIYLINKNKAFSGTRIRLSVFREDGGFYTPADNRISYLIETSPLESDHYALNKKGLRVGIYDEIKKSFSILSKYKTGNSLPFILAGNYRKSMNLDDCILLNDKRNLVETISSNLFLVKDQTIITPSVESGCVAGIMRNQIIKTANSIQIPVLEKCNIGTNDLLHADEVFLTNAINGIQWVVAFAERRYFNKTSKILLEELNKKTFLF